MVIAVFDIGKTHKKFILFNEEFKLLHEEKRIFEETEDDDCENCDDLTAITFWIDHCLKTSKYTITHLNFTTYGATLVHLGKDGKPVAPLYNYLRSIPKETLELFYRDHGPRTAFHQSTASPPLEMLNSGLQLFWLKHNKPELFEKIRTSLHFPNYLAYRYTGKMVAEKTSLGCHTALWDFDKESYHQWLESEQILDRLPKDVNAKVTFSSTISGKKVICGTGLHDSSAALVPYLEYIKKPFLLLSTGTWNITLNPFVEYKKLSEDELKSDVLYFLSHRGKPVKASRLFLGNEHDKQNEILCKHFKVPKDRHKHIKLNLELLKKLGVPINGNLNGFMSDGDSLSPLGGAIDPSLFKSYEEAYHHLNIKLTACQVKSINLVLEQTVAKKIFITGGFSVNDLFINLLSKHFSSLKIQIAHLKKASAMGAAIVVHQDHNRFFKKSKFDFKKYSSQKSKEQVAAG
ncbi:MAG: FGGY family carbohydrate kinase [Bacteroidota bacterium]